MSSNFITSEDRMATFIDKFCYIVVFPDKKVELFKSLRDIQKSICIDSSTISKKLKENNYFFKAKGSDNIFFIRKINESIKIPDKIVCNYTYCPQQECSSSSNDNSCPIDPE